MQTNIKFGTDGWRAIIAEEFTFHNVELVAQASATYWKRNPVLGRKPLIIIGYDRRFLSPEFARTTAEVFAGNGFHVILADQPTPTPAISYAVHNLQATAGIMITASHNPAKFNGYKIKAYFGGPADSELCQGIEACIGSETPIRAQENITLSNLRPAYYQAIKAQVDMQLIGQSGLRFAHDALFGAGAGCFEEILKETNCQVTTINGNHDPLFGGINPEPIEKNCRLGSAFLKQHPHDFCLVTDGDADRIGAMDGNGNYLSAHQVICLVLYHLHTHKGRSGAFIKAISTTSMTEDMCKAYGCPVTEVPIGFKNVVPEITKDGAMMAGEESGSLGFHNHIPERDGMLAGLFILELLAIEKRPLTVILAEIEAKYGKRFYRRIDATFPLNKTQNLLAEFKSNPPSAFNYTSPNLPTQPLTLERINTLDGVKYLFNNQAWLLLRTSGTEPIIRLYAEARSPEAVEALLAYGEQKVKACGTLD